MIFKVIFQVLLLFTISPAHAGLFGPKNYDECVLDKMKGQDRSLLYNARSACEREFPSIVKLDNNKIEYTWCESSATSEVICMKNAPKSYKIERIEGLFFYAECGAERQPKPGVTAEAEKPLYGSKFTFKELPSGNRRCVYLTFYGYENQ